VGTGAGGAEVIGGKAGGRCKYFVLSPDSEAIARVARMVDEGEAVLVPVVVFPVSDAVAAWEAAGERGGKGKIVIDFTS